MYIPRRYLHKDERRQLEQDNLVRARRRRRMAVQAQPDHFWPLLVITATIHVALACSGIGFIQTRNPWFALAMFACIAVEAWLVYLTLLAFAKRDDSRRRMRANQPD